MRKWLLSSALLAQPMAFAFAQSEPWEVSADGEAALVLFGPNDQTGDVQDPANALWEVELGLRAERLLDSGATIGVRGLWRAQKDHPNRPSGAGTLFDAFGDSNLGAFSALSTGGLERFDQGPRGQLEAAYAYIDGGYGELTVGRDIGVLPRFQEGQVSVLTRANLIDPVIDPSGMNALSVRGDLTGPSTKLTYVTPRLLGVRAGLSFTPSSDAAGLDRNALRSNQSGRPGLENVVEVGLSASRRVRQSGLRWRAAVGFASAEIDPPASLAANYGSRLDAFTLGAEASVRDTRAGFSFVSADEGLVGSPRYDSWQVGVARDWGNWSGSVSYGRSDADAAKAQSEGWEVALKIPANERFAVGVAYQDRAIDVDPGVAIAADRRTRGVVVEITLNLKNVCISYC